MIKKIAYNSNFNIFLHLIGHTITVTLIPKMIISSNNEAQKISIKIIEKNVVIKMELYAESNRGFPPCEPKILTTTPSKSW